MPRKSTKLVEPTFWTLKLFYTAKVDINGARIVQHQREFLLEILADLMREIARRGVGALYAIHINKEEYLF